MAWNLKNAEVRQLPALQDHKESLELVKCWYILPTMNGQLTVGLLDGMIDGGCLGI